MSWFDDVVDFGSSVISGVGDFLGSSLGGIGGNIAKTALLGLAVNTVSNSINQENEPTPDVSSPPVAMVDPGIRLQVDPSTEQKIPVLYGSATFGGNMTDAWLTSDNRSMYYAFALSERTGTLLSTDSDSAYVFNDVFLNDNRVIFQSDGITVDYTIDREGNQDISLRGLVRIYCYAGNSDLGQVPEYYTNPSVPAAYEVMPNWTTAHDMEDLIFAIVRIDYSKDKNLSRVPTVQFTITNSMSLPGDCLYDYMTNTRYGAGIPAGDIYA